MELGHIEVALSGGGVMLIVRRTPKLLMPVPQWEWREPSQSRPKDQFGNPGVRTRFRIRGRLNDGHMKFCLWFDSRDDTDAFLWSLAQYVSSGTPIPREEWGMADEIWGNPELYPWLQYDFATITYLTTPTGSNETYTSPSDWNNSDNLITVIGAGGSGGAYMGTGHATGGGGGAYAEAINFAFATPGTTTATYRIGAHAGVTVRPVDGGTSGAAGGDTWWNGATLGAASAGAKGGSGGAAGTGSRNGGAGGSAASGTGSNKKNGGRGGNLTGSSGSGGSGGGGAAALGGAGGDAGDSSSTGSAVNTNGGASGSGTSGGSGSDGGGNGNSGTELGSGNGSGSGGGGGGDKSAGSGNGAGGNYGGGGSGGRGTVANVLGARGGPGIVVVSYTPVLSQSGGFFSMF